jgi:hypothetical protein
MENSPGLVQIFAKDDYADYRRRTRLNLRDLQAIHL